MQAFFDGQGKRNRMASTCMKYRALCIRSKVGREQYPHAGIYYMCCGINRYTCLYTVRLGMRRIHRRAWVFSCRYICSVKNIGIDMLTSYEIICVALCSCCFTAYADEERDDSKAEGNGGSHTAKQPPAGESPIPMMLAIYVPSQAD